MEKIKKGDQVQIIAGKDKGKKGEVIRSIPKKDRIVVKGVNVVKKSVKKSKENSAGGYIEVEAAMHASNMMLFCPKCNKGVRVGIVLSDKGDKNRVCKKCGHKFE